MKYLDINIKKHAQDLYDELYEMLMRNQWSPK